MVVPCRQGIDWGTGQHEAEKGGVRKAGPGGAREARKREVGQEETAVHRRAKQQVADVSSYK